MIMQNFNLGSLFLNGTIDMTLFVIVIAILVILVIAAWLISWKMSANNLKVQYEKQNGDIETQRNKMLDDVREESRAIKKEAILEAKEQEIKLRNEFERETKEKKVELQRMENRLNQKEETLEKKEENLAKRNEETTRQQNALKVKENELDKKIEEINAQHDAMIHEFEKISQMSKEEAINSGAECMFIEKYPDIVTVYSIGNISKELCGGPHVKNTSEIGEFKILKEEASSAGVRRIKAIIK